MDFTEMIVPSEDNCSYGPPELNISQKIKLIDGEKYFSGNRFSAAMWKKSSLY